MPLTCGFATPLPAPSLCSRPRYPASPVPSGAPCHLVARATPRSAQNRGRIFLCSDPKRLSRFGHHEASCAPRRARIPTQRPVFGLETPPSYQRQAKKPDHMSGVHKPTVIRTVLCSKSVSSTSSTMKCTCTCTGPYIRPNVISGSRMRHETGMYSVTRFMLTAPCPPQPPLQRGVTHALGPQPGGGIPAATLAADRS